ncbi:1,3-beta-glucanosyltransferase [Thoreauomyces humboldtii]|nr:1,3-beta-glucanosyltransferase [Thoreauomyces humboldtii]
MKLSLLALSAFAVSAVVAAPASHRKSLRTIAVKKHTSTDSSVSRIDRALANKKYQIARYAQHYKAQADSLTGAKGSSGDVPLTNDANELYYGPVTIGSQQFNVDFDTGSSDFWLRGSSCTSSDGSCGSGQNGVDTSSLTDAGQTFSDSYGSGQASGEIYQADYSVGGLTASKGYFGVSTAETGFSDPSDGLFGLAFSQLSNIGQATDGKAPIDALGATSFAFYLSNDSSESGELAFGGADSSKYSGEFSYIPLNAQTYWQFDTSSATASVSGQSFQFTTAAAIADSGTTLLIVDDAVATSIYSAVGADSSGNVDCSLASSGPDVVFNLAGNDYTIPASTWVFDSGNSQCICGIQGGASSAGVVIFGDVFMRQYYTLFDVSNQQLGFAKAK